MIQTRPLIGIPCRHDISAEYLNSKVQVQNVSYLKAVTQAGGVPLPIPLNLDEEALCQLYQLTQGILLPGGGDVTPALIGEDVQARLSDVQPDRDEVEMTLTRWAVKDNKPLLGICRGIQIIAAAFGGKLCQDLPTLNPEATKHNYTYVDDTGPGWTDMIHTVELTEGTRLAKIVGSQTIEVNSLHHQAVTEVVEPLVVTGVSSDGVVEVIEHPSHAFLCGVQWHPETLVPEHKEARLIFEAFIQASLAYKGE